MLRSVCIAVLILLTAGSCSAENPCKVKLGTGNVNVLLRDGPNAYEPVCQPERIRINDRTPATIHVIGVSPTEACTVTASPPTVTAVANPVSGIITSLAGLQFFSFGDNALNSLVQSAAAPLIEAENAPVQPEETKHQTQKEKDEAARKKKELIRRSKRRTIKLPMHYS